MTLRDRIIGYIREKYGCEAEHLWRSWPDYAVFRHGDNRRWFSVVMNVPEKTFGLPGLPHEQAKLDQRPARRDRAVTRTKT